MRNKIMIIKRNLLCIKRKEKLDEGDLLLYEPYKNILVNFVNLSMNKKATDFDPVSRAFDGIETVEKDRREYYEALLGVTSYYQHSQGGRGKYIEKKIASVSDSCILGFSISNLPLWLGNQDKFRKQAILGKHSLTSEEKSILRKFNVDWTYDIDETTDLANLIKKENTLVFLEVKNRVDSGGTAGRREIWTKKFETILNYFNTLPVLYKDSNENKLNIVDILKKYNISNIEMYVGIIFDTNGKPATLEGDKRYGFYSCNKEGYNALKKYFKDNKRRFTLIKADDENLLLKAELIKENINFQISKAYGNEIPKFLLKKDCPVEELLLLKYDDIWLSQLLAIDERTFLLKHNNNFTLTFQEIVARDHKVREKFDDLINSDGEYNKLKYLINYLLKEYDKKFKKSLIPRDKEVDSYLSDVVQIFAAMNS